MFFKQIDEKENIIRMSSFQIEKLNITSEKIFLHFGKWKQEFILKMDNTLTDNQLGIPQSLATTYTFPEDIEFDVKFDSNILKVGPLVCGIVISDISKEPNYYVKKRYNELQSNGLYFICSTSSIDVDNNSIQGKYVTRDIATNELVWKQGIFPLPDAIFTRRLLKNNLYLKLVHYIGYNIFNSCEPNQMVFYQWMFSNSEAKNYVPYSERLKTTIQVVNLTKKYSGVFLKPINSIKGKGIVKIECSEYQKYIITKDANQLITLHQHELEKFLLPYLKSRYIIQQQIISASSSEQKIDFRAYLQKNSNKKWVFQGYIGRIAKKGSIITNLKHVDRLENGSSALKKMFKSEDILTLEEKIKDTCLLACKVIDKNTDNMGDLAVDFIINKNMEIFILEVNGLYGTTSLLKLKETKLFKKIMKTPFEYAKSLAKF